MTNAESSAPEPTHVPHGRAGRINAVDGVRAIAFLLVLVYHTGQFAGPTAMQRLPYGLRQIAQHGAAGVDVFIVLSGFCLFLPVVNHASSFTARGFWRKRIRRIVPAYYASIAFVILLPELLVVLYRLLGMSARWQHPPGWEQLIAHGTFTHTLFPETWDGINGSYWSLGLEAEFYLLMPALVWLYAKFGARGITIPVSISIIWNIVLYAMWNGDRGFVVAHFLWGATAPGRWLEFGLGMAGAYTVVRHPRITGRFGPALGWLGVLGILGDLVLVEGSRIAPLRLAILAISSTALLMAASQARGWVSSILGWRPLTLLGLTSYSFYLLHQPTEYYFSQLLHRLKLGEMSVWVLELTVGFAMVGALAIGSYWIFERQYLRARKHQHGLADVTSDR